MLYHAIINSVLVSILSSFLITIPSLLLLTRLGDLELMIDMDMEPLFDESRKGKEEKKKEKRYGILSTFLNSICFFFLAVLVLRR